jgi:4-amino-4-deoxy-L-arabinose transferase-like glycosyltransferase
MSQLATIVKPAPEVFAPKRAYFKLALNIAVLLLVAIFLRLPYFCQTVIHWHESTYILLAQDLLDHHLPQTVLSELKPPFAMLPYSAFILLFGKSIAAVRLGGLICVFLASSVVYLACRKQVGNGAALFAGIAVSLFSTLEDGGGCTMIEHIALVPLSLALLIETDRKVTFRRSFLVGLLIGLAAALKTNLALFIIAPLILAGINYKQQGIKTTFKIWLMLLLGVLLPKLAVIPIYAFSNHLALSWQSSVIAPWVSVAHHRSQILANIPTVIEQVRSIKPASFLLAWVLPAASLIVAIKRRNQRECAFVLISSLFLITGLLTIIAAGILHARRYYIVLVPFAACMSSLVVDRCLTSRYRIASIAPLITAALLSLPPICSAYAKAYNAISNKENSDTAYKISQYLRQQHVAGKYAYFQSNHIGYWLTGARIPTRFVHPMDLTNYSLLKTLYTEPSSPTHELQVIFAKQPVYVVTHTKHDKSKNEFMQGLYDELQRNYQLKKNIDGVGIFKRI